MIYLSKLRNSEKSFIIAEVGQNHQGDLNIALEYVREFARLGADAIKFQCRNNRFLFDRESYDRHYDSENAFGETYGEHREFLELSGSELAIVRDECRSCGVYFMATPFDELSLELLLRLDVDVLKIASFDLGNIPLITKMAKTKKPIVMSVGGGKIHHIIDSVDCIQKYHDNLAVLHCVSEYPTPLNHIGLKSIVDLSDKLPETTIGLSDHFNGILTGPLGFILGARVFEKHVTFDRANKGTDHSFALEPDGFRRFVRDIRRVPEMMEPKSKEKLGEEPVFIKLGKSLVCNKDLSVGTIISIDDLSGKIFHENHVPVRDSAYVIGQELKKDISAGEPLVYGEHLHARN